MRPVALTAKLESPCPNEARKVELGGFAPLPEGGMKNALPALEALS